MKSIYIAGKVTGLPYDEVLAKFQLAETLLAKKWQVVNPLKVVDNPQEEWHAAMEKCLAALDQCDAIYMLPCSVDSPGAKIELQYALENNKMVYYELENVQEDDITEPIIHLPGKR